MDIILTFSWKVKPNSPVNRILKDFGFLENCYLVDGSKKSCEIAGFYDPDTEGAYILLDNVPRLKRYNINDLYDAVICVINHEVLHHWASEEWPVEKIEEWFDIKKVDLGKKKKKGVTKQVPSKK